MKRFEKIPVYGIWNNISQNFEIGVISPYSQIFIARHNGEIVTREAHFSVGDTAVNAEVAVVFTSYEHRDEFCIKVFDGEYELGDIYLTNGIFDPKPEHVDQIDEFVQRTNFVKFQEKNAEISKNYVKHVSEITKDKDGQEESNTTESPQRLLCDGCKFVTIVSDPDPVDWFNKDDIAILCSQEEPTDNDQFATKSLGQLPHRCIPGSGYRPYQDKNIPRPNWCKGFISK